MYWVLATFFGFLLVFLSFWKSKHDDQLNTTLEQAKKTGHTTDELERYKKANSFFLPQPYLKHTRLSLMSLFGLFLGLALWNGAMFYAEPGYKYHVRDIFGQEFMINDVGYRWYGFGRINAWKKAMTVQASVLDGPGEAMESHEEDVSNAEGEESETSASLPPMNIVFLDQVDADVSATARFRLPNDEESFFNMVHEYRTPENLLRTALIPAFRETLQANASLMSAEEYYSGARTEFNISFDNQMKNGIYIVERKEEVVEDETAAVEASANATMGTAQQPYGENKKIIFKVEKQYDKNGQPRRKHQSFIDFGIMVVEARITDMSPNEKFRKRMELKQQASADRAIAREQRIQEEERKLYIIAKGEREIAEKQNAAKVEQIERTTNAETEKQLAVTNATKEKEQAEIDKETSEIRLEQAKIDAQRTKTLADAEAYKKRAIIRADNALKEKMETEIKIQEVWAEAYAKRAVPTYVFGAGGGTPTGSDGEASNFMQLMTMEAAKRLNYDRTLDPDTSVNK